MSFPYDAATLAAIDRLQNFYNGGDYDAATNPGGMGLGGHRINFVNALADAALVGTSGSDAAAAAGVSATAAGVSETNAAASATKLLGSSTTSLAIGTGSKAFTTQAGKFFSVGTFLLIYSEANPTERYMAGQVIAYSGTDLTVSVTVAVGSGTYSDWTIAVAGSPGAKGDTGSTGPVGPTASLQWLFSDSVTDSDPGNGSLRLNNAAAASATQIFFDNLERNGASVTAFLDSLDDSTNTALRGTLNIVQVSAPSNFAVFNVTGAVVDGTGYRKVPVTHVASNGAFTNAAVLSVSFTRTGNKGADGGGAGDVIGPSSATDNHVALFDGSTGKLLKGGGALSAVALSGDAADVVFTPTGDLTSTNAQAALAELDSEKASASATTTALSGKQPLDALLTALAALVTAADKGLYFTGADAPATFDLTNFMRGVLATASAAAARAALLAIGVQQAGCRNLIINGDFRINQRAFAGGSVAGGAYWYDRWKTGGSGASVAVSAGVATIMSGAIRQDIEGASIKTGTYCINWTGDAICAVNGVGASKGASFNLTGGTNAVVVFSGNGTTVTNVQLEFGDTPTAFEVRHIGLEVVMCARYYSITRAAMQLPAAGSGIDERAWPVEMRAAPATSVLNAGTLSNATVASEAGAATTYGGTFQITTSAANGFVTGRIRSHDAEI